MKPPSKRPMDLRRLFLAYPDGVVVPLTEYTLSEFQHIRATPNGVKAGLLWIAHLQKLAGTVAIVV